MADREELTRRGFAAVRNRDFAVLEQIMHPEIELESRFSPVGDTIYRGHEGIRAWLDDLADAWEYIEVELESLVEEGDDVTLALVTLRGKGRESGVEIGERVAQRHRWRDDRLVKVEYVERPEH